MQSSEIKSLIINAVRSSTLMVSPISIWEIAMLESKGRIALSLDCLDWVHRALNAPGLSLCPFDPEIAVESTRLPGDFHGDPADRILVASARKLNASLLTADKRILSYAEAGHLSAWAIP